MYPDTRAPVANEGCFSDRSVLPLPTTAWQGIVGDTRRPLETTFICKNCRRVTKLDSSVASINLQFALIAFGLVTWRFANLPSSGLVAKLVVL